MKRYLFIFSEISYTRGNRVISQCSISSHSLSTRISSNTIKLQCQKWHTSIPREKWHTSIQRTYNASSQMTYVRWRFKFPILPHFFPIFTRIGLSYRSCTLSYKSARTSYANLTINNNSVPHMKCIILLKISRITYSIPIPFTPSTKFHKSPNCTFVTQ